MTLRILGNCVDSRKYTTIRPIYKRANNFNVLNNKHLDFFNSLLEKEEIQTKDLDSYNTDWMKKYKGQSKLVLKPKEASKISEILRYCNMEKLAVVPQGGNTGLVGGSVPAFDEIILSTKNINKIIAFDKTNGAIVCEAGCILQTLDEYVQENGFIVPLDLGAKGGNVSTNAGGLRLMRYGSLKGSVLGLEAILADGAILSNLNTMRKDNTVIGYDLNQLFIGSEGTLGFITKVSLLCVPKPKLTRSICSEILSAAFEFWDEHSMELTLKNAKLHSPLAGLHKFYVLIETSGSDSDHDQSKLDKLMNEGFSKEIVQDGIMAQDVSQIKNIWSYREFIPEACSREGSMLKYDISLPQSKLYSIVEQFTSEYLMHDYSPDLISTIEPLVYNYVAENGGSISGEHGIGIMKVNYLQYAKSPSSIKLMKKSKEYA
ncbi:CO dehydrogenase flavoprotein-like, FAD-binding, sub 2 domain-containing protein [Rozella allomycis CSF55]|uniref:CO dehydrogenase flavoprotein-like, FAD-binding, sub 2 domain-containing protein n=1 Tax=Rozella allomycis (strain CSF55) TaxID=988480 RepID=A0A075ASB8_ROZAC|nr:CO dehydrogenase flavoprotein-like, FAD-binding, sub 2 domain-containing protein [Rozella allomycis CSF55]|eukprot:EPZ31581.1 CO dehydrogenase flavoprotein-like, FAD-binding, sub 2 domain-containing protein [Rozella allomycis CSF55]